MTKAHNQSTQEGGNASQPRPNSSSYGQSATQATTASMDLTSNEPLLIAVGETRVSQSEHFTPVLNGFGVEDLSHPSREIQSQEVQNDSTTISLSLEGQSSTTQTTSSQGYQPGFQEGGRSSPALIASLGDDFFWIKNFASPLSCLMGQEEQMMVVSRAECLRIFKETGMPKPLLVAWEAWYCLDLFGFYVHSRIKIFTDLIKLVNINLK